MLSYIFYRIGEFIALSLPIKAAYKIGVFFSDIHYLFANKDRRSVRENLKAIFPQKSEKEIRRIRLQMSRNFAKYLVDFFRFSVINKEYIAKNVTVENINYVKEAASKGKGVILVSAHIGNWELGGVVASLLGYPLWVVALTHKNKRVDDFFNAHRTSKGVNVIPLGKAVRRCLSALSQGKILALVGDRDFTDSGARILFFGKTMIFPEGPAAFAIKTHAPIIAAFTVRNSDDTFTFRFEKPIETDGLLYNDENIKTVIAQYKTIFEDYIRKYPEQWFMFRRFWIDDSQ